MVLTNILEEGGGELLSRYPIYGSAIAFEPGVWNSTQGLSDGVTYPAASEACRDDIKYCSSEAADSDSLQVIALKTNDDGMSLYCPYAYRGPPDQSIYNKCSLAQPEFCPSMDLAFAYDYSNITVPEAEWYTAPRCLYLREGITSGYWTSPYFDAGAGNINMVTYAQPIISQSGKFLGIATIDVTVDALCYGAQCKPKDNFGVRWVGYTLGFVIIAMALFFGGWVILNRKHRIVKISQPIFLHLVIFGVLVLSLAIFPLGVNETNASVAGCNIACASIPWLVSLGFSLIFAALFSKLWRINRVFTAASQMRRVVVTEKDVILPFAILMTLNFVLLLSWTLIDPMVYVRVYTDALNSYGHCVPKGNQWKGFISMLAILNFAALIIVNIQAFKARKIHDELSESKYIGLATLSMLQIFIVGVPLLVIVYNDPSAYFFVWCGIIFIICTTILLLIFVPKVISWKYPARNSRRGTNFSSGYTPHGTAVVQTANTTGVDRIVSNSCDVENAETSPSPESAPGERRVSFQ